MNADDADRRAREIEALRDSGILDAAWYVAHNADLGHSGEDPHAHYVDRGWKEGRAPNFYLDPRWYLDSNPDIRGAGFDPVLHYLLHGDAEGRRPGPFFDNAWYRARHGLGPQDKALAHYLAHRQHGASPIPEFDAEFYLATYRDVARAGADAFDHYVTIGWREGREPGPDFDSRYYVRRHMDGAAEEAPLLHWLRHRHDPGVHPRMPQETPTIPRQVRRNTRPGDEFEEPRPLPDGAKPRAKVLAYYLPQFHAIAENDAWWGTGFTEWTNLARGLPRFAGHYQPRVPRDLGHYHLGGPDAGAAVMRRQIDMAKRGGVHGFIFYWYWFNGHRLLEKPVEAFLADRTLDMPFALMWANENWTRRWDGAANDVLMSQDYRAEEEGALIAELARHFADPRYIRVAGRPVITMYRASLVPDTKDAVAGWRRRFREEHGEDPVFVMAQSFDDEDPRPLGFDAAIEFPPHKLAKRTAPISASLDYLDPDFSGTVFSFDEVVRASLDEPEPDYPLIKCAVPGWDNDPRKQGNGTVVIHGAKPATYEAWLAELVERAARTPFFGEPLVCVNAWNEWCEGAYLEPDLHYGAAFLNATARAVTGRPAAEAPALLVAAADAEEDEAARRLLAVLTAIRRRTGLRIEVLLLAGGPLEEEYGRLGHLTVAADMQAAGIALDAARAGGVRRAVMTLAAAGRLAAAAAAREIACTVLLAEMPGEIRARERLPGLRALRHADAILAPAAAVVEAVAAEFGLPATPRPVVVEPGLPAPPAFDAAARDATRRDLGLGPEARLLLGAGPGDLRHGIDLFLQLFRRLRARDAAVRAVWVGALDPAVRAWMGAELAEATREGLRVVEHLAAPGALHSAADVFALTAREAAFPLVAQEAIATGLPVVAFAGAGGGAGLATACGGHAVPLGDVEAMAGCCAALLAALATAAERAGRQAAAAARFAFEPAAEAMLAHLLPDLPDIAVAVPGAGAGRLLATRLDPVFRQDMPLREVVLLDEAADPRVAAGAAEGAARWQRVLRRVPGPAGGDWSAQARAALAASPAAFVWLVDRDAIPGGAFLRRAAAALAGAPGKGFARAGTPAGAVLWRREALAAAALRPAPSLDALCAGAEGVLLADVPLLRHPPLPTMREGAAPPAAPAAPAGARVRRAVMKQGRRRQGE
ncbi:glycoside hydrolase family 99-like domain-containing protein [Falsiroseomonas sp. CW058]|uniref:glycoside hydrolase family 99-like domain-containing protein n=1 Tax=Falsiroseomonas sp. CW058 TaxID=3388664 RepID=UPI003D313FBF